MSDEIRCDYTHWDDDGESSMRPNIGIYFTRGQLLEITEILTAVYQLSALADDVRTRARHYRGLLADAAQSS